MRLNEQRDALKKDVDLLMAGIKRLQSYVYSDKFSIDPYVNKDDVILRISEVLNDPELNYGKLY